MYTLYLLLKASSQAAAPPTAAHSQEWDSRCAISSDHNFMYRVLRKKETPHTLRTPPQHVQDTPWKEQRIPVLEALAFGNQATRQSPYIHCTGNLIKAVAIQSERSYLYSDILVRFKAHEALHEDNWLSWTHPVLRSVLVVDLREDTPAIAEMVKRIQGFMTKDQECVSKQRPDLAAVEYWDGDHSRWLPALDWKPRMPVLGRGRG